MNLNILTKNLVFRLENGENISSAFYPSDITLDSKLTKDLKNIEAITNKDNSLASSIGQPIGWEYGINIFFFLDQIYWSKPIAGNYNSVRLASAAKVNPIQKESMVSFEVQIGDKTEKTKAYKVEDINKQKIAFQNIASFHTHPKVLGENKKMYYTFFSATDMYSLLNSSQWIHGLVAGKDLWLACRTSSSFMPSQEDLNQMTRLEYQEDIEAMKKYLKENFKNYNIAFYHASFGGLLRRVV